MKAGVCEGLAHGGGGAECVCFQGPQGEAQHRGGQAQRPGAPYLLMGAEESGESTGDAHQAEGACCLVEMASPLGLVDLLFVC